MLEKILYFLVLCVYINTLFYQEGHSHGGDSSQVIDGAPLVELIFEDLLDIPVTENEPLTSDLQYDDYRPASSNWIAVPLFPKILELVTLPAIDLHRHTTHPFINSKISCLIGYYSFLFRLKPF